MFHSNEFYRKNVGGYDEETSGGYIDDIEENYMDMLIGLTNIEAAVQEEK